MKPYKQHRPTAFDPAGAFLPDRQEWLVAPVSRTRDSEVLAESNFQAFLDGLGGESEHVEVHRFGHWGPGWYEIILIDPSVDHIVTRATEMADALENYPVLDEDDLCKREHEAENEAWNLDGRGTFLGRLRSKIGKEWNDQSEHGFNPEEIDDGMDLLTDDDIDCLWHNAADKANWVCEHHSDGPCFNYDGVLKHVNVSQVVEMVDAYLWKKCVERDIRKLCAWLGAAYLADQAVSLNLVLVSQIRVLQRKEVQVYPV